MRYLSRLVFSGIGFAIIASSFCTTAQSASRFELKSGDRVVFVGDTLMEREQAYGWMELMLTSRFPDREITFRNLGWSGDTPAGISRLGLSLRQAGHEPAGEGWKLLSQQIQDAKPTVAMIGYGMASSFEGEAGLAGFEEDYQRLIKLLKQTRPDVRLVLLSPIPHESLGPPWPGPTAHNAQLAAYAKVVARLAASNGATLVPLFDLFAASVGRMTPLTTNGIHLSDTGYRTLAESLEGQLFGSETGGKWRSGVAVEPLRQAIMRKNEWFFHRSRPANLAYILGFRKGEQGQNAVEIQRFDGLIAAEEQRIAQLRSLQPVNVPEIPRRVGNLNAAFVPQAHPEFTVADGFEVTLWAENPLLGKPVQMNFDARGRLWVASSELYPQIEPGQAPTDKIIVLEDPTGEGRASKATVFADGLLIPTGLEVGDGGVYVAQSTELLHFRDNDGDGKADERRTVLSGFGTEDTHHNLHTLRWGPDGRLYMNQSVYTRTDTETPQGVIRLKAGGVFRFDPRDQKLDILYRGWVNAWGHQFDDFGQSFVTDGAGNRGVSWAMPGATYQTLAPARRELQSSSPGNYPKFCGIEIVRSDTFPADWQGDVITCDFRAHRIVRFKLSDQGAGYITSEMPDLMRTTSDTFRPIDVRFGPDGALYVADWSNPIIQHGEVDFRDPRRDKSHGRIWRISAKGGKTREVTDLTKMSNRSLLDLLLSSNSYDQENARRVLVERGSTAVVKDLETWTSQLPAGDESARLRALWMYQAFNQDHATLIPELLRAHDPRIRAAVVRGLPGTGYLEELATLVADENPRVRAEAVRALGRRGTSRAAELALSVLDRPMDPFLEYALWLSINELADPWLIAVKSGGWRVEGREAQLAFGLKSVEPSKAGPVLGPLLARTGLPHDGSGPWIELIGTAGQPSELNLLFDALLSGDLPEPAERRAFQALSDAARLREARPNTELDRLRKLLDAPADSTRIAAIKLAGQWQIKALASDLLARAGDANRSAEERGASFGALRSMGGPETAAGLRKISRSNAPAPIRREAVVSLASINVGETLPDVITLLRTSAEEAETRELWRSLLQIKGLSAQLASFLAHSKLTPAAARAGIRPAREGGQHQALLTILLEQSGEAISTAILTGQQLKDLAAEALAKGDARRGEQIYRRPELACVVCHAIGGAGGKLGPDLTSIGASAPPDYLVESLLYPNAKIKEGYHSVLLTTKDGRELNGMIVRETAAEVTLRDSAGTITSLSPNAVVNRASVGSLMPAGLLDPLLPEERMDLVKFLAQLGRPGPYDAAMGGVARAWKLYGVTYLNEPRGAQRVTRGDFNLPDWQPVLSLVDGSLPAEAITAADRDRRSVRGLFAATQFVSVNGGQVAFDLVGDAKAAWLNGQPVTPGAHFIVNAQTGANVLVLQLPQDRPVTSIRLSSREANFALE